MSKKLRYVMFHANIIERHLLRESIDWSDNPGEAETDRTIQVLSSHFWYKNYHVVDTEEVSMVELLNQARFSDHWRPVDERVFTWYNQLKASTKP